MTNQLLDFEDERYQKGYALFKLSKESAKKNIGKSICYLLKRDYDSRRGYMSVRYGTINAVRYSQLIFEHGDSIDIRDVLECGIKIEQ